jgi:hypothetical protein
MTSDYGIGVAVDIEGNCRFYDFIRFKKMCKISSLNSREEDARFVIGGNKCRWRLLPSVTMEMSADSFLAVTQLPEIAIDSAEQDKKQLCDKDIFIDKLYSDTKENLKSLSNIAFESSESPFYLQRSSLSIFRFEDVIFNLYPQLASVRRKGMPTKEVFLSNNPEKESTTSLHDD